MRRPPQPRRRAQRGHSLLEMVSVVTIAGSLTAVAAPRFTDLPGEARVAVVRNMEGVVYSATALLHMKCAVESQCDLRTGATTLEAGGDPVRVSRGYPEGGHDLGIANAIQYTGFTALHEPGRTVFSKDGAPQPTQCAVVYDAPDQDGDAPVIVARTAGC